MRLIAIPRLAARPIWTALTVLAFIVLAPITARADEKVIRIGYQKYGTLILLKAKGPLEAKLKPLGYRVAWAELGCSRPLMRRRSVLLPQPLLPTMATNWPAGMCRSRPRSTVVSPKALASPLRVTATPGATGRGSTASRADRSSRRLRA